MNELNGIPINIQLFYLGGSYITSPFFQDYQLKVITRILNVVREYSRDNPTPKISSCNVRDELSKICRFESVNEDSYHIRNYNSKCCSLTMEAFAYHWELCLNHMANLPIDEFAELFTEYNMLDSDEKLKSILPKSEYYKMWNFCKSLKENILFVASAAGCKSAFHKIPSLSKKFEISGEDEQISTFSSFNVNAAIHGENFTQQNFQFGIFFQSWRTLISPHQNRSKQVVFSKSSQN